MTKIGWLNVGCIIASVVLLALALDRLNKDSEKFRVHRSGEYKKLDWDEINDCYYSCSEFIKNPSHATLWNDTGDHETCGECLANNSCIPGVPTDVKTFCHDREDVLKFCRSEPRDIKSWTDAGQGLCK